MNRTLPLAVTAMLLLTACATQGSSTRDDGVVIVPAKAAALLGIWMIHHPEGKIPDAPGPIIDEETLPLTDYGRRRMEARREEIQVRGLTQSDRSVKCLPPGMPQLMTPPFAIQIIPLQDRIVMIPEASRLVRTIFMNKKSHPEDLEPSWNGHGIGHWEGDTLVVETVGFNDRDTFVFNYNPPVKRTSSLKVTERIRINAEGYLEDQVTLDDPRTFTRPYTLTYRYRKLEPDAELFENVCEVDAQKIIRFDANKIDVQP